MAQKEQELRLSWHAPSANNATTTLPKQAEASRQNGASKILQILQKAYLAQRN